MLFYAIFLMLFSLQNCTQTLGCDPYLPQSNGFSVFGGAAKVGDLASFAPRADTTALLGFKSALSTTDSSVGLK